ncbi:zinc finger protein 62-like [Malaya genurostris]|uniref:zinc finger protein 62-like n=1 Tax=Malaya genurostris TaxID=325434 RepID=UPI0026F3936E|nr:zinc finger protein 62-like [Malaya genurostris]
MVAFNLSTFPEVCRLCLQSKHPDEMVSVHIERPMQSGSLGDLLEEFTFKIPTRMSNYFPSEVCSMCLEVFDFFYKYKQKLYQIHLFLKAFVDVKLGNKDPLVKLLNDNKEYFSILFKDLDICNKEELLVEDLLEEYQYYKISAMANVKDEASDEKQVEPAEAKNYELHVEIIDDIESVKDADHAKIFLEQLGSYKVDNENVKQIEIKAEPVYLLSVIRDDSQFEIEELPSNGSDQVDDFNEDAASKHDTSDIKLIFSDDGHHDENMSIAESNEESSSRDALEVHQRSHEEKSNTPNKEFNTRQPRLPVSKSREHQPRELRKKHVCDICGATLKHKYSLEVHLGRHAGVTQFQCQYCSSSFHTKTEMRNHLRSIHTTGSSCECAKCGAVFKTKKLLNQHLESHAEKRNFKCETCEFAFKTLQHLKRHITTVHREVRFSCNHCTMSYGRKDKLRMHMERAHNIQSYFVCDICLRSFNGKQALDEHKGHHANPKPLECGVCLMAFEDGRTFDDHLCISYRDSYECCGKDFKYHVHFNRHVLMEHGIKSNARVRPKRGLLIGQLRADRRLREVRCRKCDRNFVSMLERKRHVCVGNISSIGSAEIPATSEEMVNSDGAMFVSEMGEEEHLEDVDDNLEIEYIISEETESVTNC